VSTTSEIVSCRACGLRGPAAGTLVLHESMFGTLEPFAYARCGACGSLYIVEVPDDLGAHYPDGYYAHATTGGSRVRAAVGRALLATRLGRLPVVPAPGFVRWTLRSGVPRGCTVLDVGSGTGATLADMAATGWYGELVGVDPFLDADRSLPGGVTLRSCGIDDVDGTFDLVTMNHSLEHVPDPRAHLAALRDRIGPGGRAVVRVPVVDAAAWDRYGVDWVQLDPPRHLTLFTRRALVAAAEEAGFEVVALHDDGGSFQFWGSEERRAGIPLASPASRSSHGLRRRLRDPRRWWWALLAVVLNLRGRGDSVALHLRPRHPAPTQPG
jgi:SAM-dependent methyltransferase